MGNSAPARGGTALDLEGRDLLRAGLESIIGRCGSILPETVDDTERRAMIDVMFEDLTVYIRELEMWNLRLGLIEAWGHDIVKKHILDSLAPMPTLLAIVRSRPQAAVLRFADIGSGAGFPGFPLALALRTMFRAAKLTWQAEVHLVEKQRRRVGFLMNVRALLKCDSVIIDERDLAFMTEHVRLGLEARFDYVLARAFKPLEPEILDKLQGLAGPGGLLFLYKGRKERIREELTACGMNPCDWDEVREGCLDTWDESDVTFDASQRSGLLKVAEASLAVAKGDKRAAIVPVRVPLLDDERHIVLIRGAE